jgi:hypothetical protein
LQFVVAGATFFGARRLVASVEVFVILIIVVGVFGGAVVVVIIDKTVDPRLLNFDVMVHFFNDSKTK